MKLFVFSSKNITNIWAGVGARMWAVSDAEESVMKARQTRAKCVEIGNLGLLYCSDPNYQALTTPFIFTSKPKHSEEVTEIWPETWQMPFGIFPLGSPRRTWPARNAAQELPFNKQRGETNISSVFKLPGTAVFSPIDVSDADWSMILSKLAEI